MIIIPKTLEECYTALDNLGSGQWLKLLPEDRALTEVHMGIGTWMRNNWGLWSGQGELCEWFKSNLIRHPDDMSAIILTSYYRYKNNKAIRLDEQFDFYIMYWLTDKQKLLRKRKQKLEKIQKLKKLKEIDE